MVSGGKNMNDVIRMMFFAMQKNNLLFDHVISVDNQDIPSMSWGYDARMAILEDDDSSVSPFIKKQINEYYHPHILVLPDLHWEPSDIFPEYEDYLQSMKRLIASIERDGKLIYNERISDLGMLAGLIREDVTAMPYKIHPVKEEDGHTLLTSRFGEFKVNKADDAFLENINAARIACRQMGLPDKDFYEAISEYSFK